MADARKIQVWNRNLNPEQQEAINLALVEAVSRNDAAQVPILVAKGANPDHIDSRSFRSSSRKTPLHNACIHGWTEAGIALLECGANPRLYTNICGSEISCATPLHYAARNGNIRLINALLNAGANPHATKYALIRGHDEEGLTALHYAAQNGRAEAVATLMARGCFHSANDLNERTPLHLACENGHADCIALLLKAGADPNMPSWKEMSPLHHAANAIREGKDGGGDAVRILAAFGADPITFNRMGKLPEDGMTAAQVRIFRKALEDGAKMRAQELEKAEEAAKRKKDAITLPLTLRFHPHSSPFA